MSFRTALKIYRHTTTSTTQMSRVARQGAYSSGIFQESTKATQISPKPQSENFITRAYKYLKAKINNLLGRTPKVVKTPPKIEPKVIKVENRGIPLAKLEDTYEYVDIDNARFHKKLHPSTMKRTSLPTDKNFIHISNFEPPYGSIAATTGLDGCITTNKIYQCAAVAIVDKSNNMQTLIHAFPGQTQKEITELIRHVTSKSNITDLEITIAPGIYEDYDKTVRGIVTALKEVGAGKKIKFANFSEDVRIFERGLILQDGKLTCCTKDEIEKATNKIVNPKEYISYVYAPYNNDPVKK
ncbi:hypothetical protein IKL64_01185 [bacterium]|nr:hypothetical protein [bacterium]